MNGKQLQLFPTAQFDTTYQPNHRSGTFVDNIKLPVHRWFRYSAGFSAQWVESILKDWQLDESSTILDPFAGGATTLLAADKCGIPSIGIEAHPFVARIAQSKLLWHSSQSDFIARAKTVQETALKLNDVAIDDYPELIKKCFSPQNIHQLTKLKIAYSATADNRPASDLTWLAITAILRPTASAKTAQWQYILPNQNKTNVAEPFAAFQSQINMMQRDMVWMQNESSANLSKIISGDARNCAKIASNTIDAVIASPPYANNYDYADATRLEMSFWGEVQSWKDLHESVRKHLIVSCSQHAAKDQIELAEILTRPELEPIRQEITSACYQLATERESHGGKKHYHTMIAAYFADMAKVWISLRRVCKSDAKICWVVGDSAPYGVYIPVDKWLGELAIAAGFKSYDYTKLRDRNTKWKNRKHRVPLQEGILWISG
ncbi:MAG TPA: DNA modification methylase [Oscillatoriaceae cyanobacterium M33_DOE_052]|uniref:DNA modification methylase n=1 Tax=Planktothricoides sp. SpSt-374 TaxID=2282167 RepID=A0A7C3ZXU9_9CYAN|nr:DNA modification methylase [Oscillatoriaceae cyanobacterium M33_DOE_052]